MLALTAENYLTVFGLETAYVISVNTQTFIVIAQNMTYKDKIMIKWLKSFFICYSTSNKYFGRNTPDIPQRKKIGLPAMERRIAASRNIIDASLMDKDNE